MSKKAITNTYRTNLVKVKKLIYAGVHSTEHPVIRSKLVSSYISLVGKAREHTKKTSWLKCKEPQGRNGRKYK